MKHKKAMTNRPVKLNIKMNKQIMCPSFPIHINECQQKLQKGTHYHDHFAV